MPNIRLVYLDGCTNICKLPDGIEERVGPILADIVANCAPSEDGNHTIAVPEIPSAVLGEPLQHFLMHGRLPYEKPKPCWEPWDDYPEAVEVSPTLLLATSYKAADRLDIRGLVRAVERSVMADVAAGTVSLADVSVAFAGCPRMVSLCDNYLDMPRPRPQPPFNIRRELPALVAEHGVLFLICMFPDMDKRMRFDSIKIISDTRRCKKLARQSPICRHIVELTGKVSSNRSFETLSIITLRDVDEQRNDIKPADPSTWVPDINAIKEKQRCKPADCIEDITDSFCKIRETSISLVVCRKGCKLFSSNDAADNAFTLGIYAAFFGDCVGSFADARQSRDPKAPARGCAPDPPPPLMRPGPFEALSVCRETT